MAVIISSMPSNVRPSFSILNDRLYIATGDSRLLVYDGITYRWAGILAPTSSQLTIASSGAGSINATIGYKYNYTYYDATDGLESDPFPLSGVASMTSFTSVSTITVSSFPATTISSQGVTAIRIYRTNDGGSTFYYSGQIALGTQVYSDTVTDASLGAEQSIRNGVFPAVKYIKAAKRRLWGAGMDHYDTGTVTVSSGSMSITGVSCGWINGMATRYFQLANSSRIYQVGSIDTTSTMTLTQKYGETQSAGASYVIYGETNRVWFSEIDSTDTPTPESCYTGLDYPDYVDLSSDGDDIVGIGEARAYTILLFKRHKIMALSGSSKSDFYLTTVHPYGGTCSHWSIANDDVGNCYYFDGERGVFHTDGVNFTSVSEHKIDDFLKEIVDTTYNSLSHGIFYPKRGWYMLWVTSKWATSPDLCMIYDTIQKEWFIREISATCSATILNMTTSETEIWIGTNDGFVFKLDDEDVLSQGVPSGTSRGTATGTQSATTLADTTASFYSGGSGIKGCFVTIKSGTGAGQRRLISSSTTTSMIVSSNWIVTPVAGDSTYCIGGFNSFWSSKWIDLDTPDFKRFYDFIMTYVNQKDSTSVKVSFFTDLISDAGTVTVTNGSPSVTGSSTLFNSDDVGKCIFFSGHNAEYVISSCGSMTTIALNREFKGTTGSGVKYCKELFSTTIDCNTGFDALVDMAVRCRYIKFRVGMVDSGRRFTIYNAGYTADGDKLT